MVGGALRSASMDDFDAAAIAVVIQRCCPETLAKGPIGFEWAMTCSKPRIGEFGGGWCAIFADRIEIDATNEALSRALAANNDGTFGWEIRNVATGFCLDSNVDGQVYAINDVADGGKPRRDEDLDGWGLTREVWHRFEIGAGARATIQQGATRCQ